MLFCGPRLRNFYCQCGWTPADSARISYGDPANPTQDKTGQIMMLFHSDKGRTLRPRIETEPVFIGNSTW